MASVAGSGSVIAADADDAPLAGATLVAVLGAAADGAVEPPVEEHAPMAMAASRASAPRRFGLMMITRCSSFDATPSRGLGRASWGSASLPGRADRLVGA